MIYRGHVVTPIATGGWADWPDGRIEVEGDLILAVGAWRRARRHVDLRPHILFPGLVDTHAHVPQLPICGVHPEDLLTWLKKWTFPLESRFRGQRARVLSRHFMQEMLEQGTTTAALYTAAWPESVHACFEAAEAVGIHAWIGPPLMDEGAYRPATTNQVIREARALATLDRPRLRFAVTPRFALSCSERLLEACGDLAVQRALPVQTHLAEQPEECREVRRRFGRRYVDVYDRAGLIGPQSIFAHCIWLTAADWRRLACAAVAHCPTSNVFLRSGTMDWHKAQAARVGFGTDVGAGPDLSVFRVARMAWTVHSLAGCAIGADELLRTATLGGAAALGFADVGSLEPGKSADFLVLDAGHIVPAGAPSAESTDDLLSRILHRSGRSSIRQVYVAGRLVSDSNLGTPS